MDSFPKNFRLWICLILAAFALRTATAQRNIPDDNLAYPVLITLGNGSFGSGFFLDTSDCVYLVTAKHVLFDAQTQRLIDPHALLRSYSKDLSDQTPNLFSVDLASLQAAGDVKLHPTQDVVVVKLFDVVAVPPQAAPSSQQVAPAPPQIQTGSAQSLTVSRTVHSRPGVQILSIAASGIAGADPKIVKRFDQVLVGNEAMVFGYPNSLGLQQLPQLDPNRPLLRKGIVAGTNAARKSIILDCPVYFGNSGGIVLQIERGAFQTNFYVIGVVDQYVPFVQSAGIQGQTLAIGMQLETNSGYSVVVPMDFVMELVDR